jgi:hypothetical protein
MTDKPKLTLVADTTGTKTPATQTRKKSGSLIGQKGMTDKQQAFVDAVFAGSNFSDAYRTAYDAQNMSAGAIHREACILAQHPKVSQRLEQMSADREREQRMQRLSRAERVVEKLEGIGIRGDTADGTQVRALELLGKTLGLFIDKVETEDKTARDPESIRAELEARLNRLIG